MQVDVTTSEEDPERSCAGCRGKDSKASLLRFAIAPADRRPQDGESPTALAPDPGGRLGGRGVSVHPTRKCLALAITRGGFARAIAQAGGKPGELDATVLASQAAELYRARAMALLGAARRSRKLAVGTDATREALHAGTIAVLVVADDGAGRKEELMEMAERMSRRCVVLGTKASLGASLGREEVAVAAILDPGIGDALLDAYARAEALREVE